MSAERRILHLDMDAYFAALEVQACPALAGRPVVVGALPASRGVVASASYPAREFGIRAGMPAAQARRLCPQAEFVPCHPALYIHTSRRLLQHLLAITPQVEMFSIDEAFLDITDVRPNGTPRGKGGWQGVDRFAREIAASIEARFGLTCSIGVGPNRAIAKMAAKLEKPRGVTLLGETAFRRLFWPKPVGQLYGVGPRTEAGLMLYGIETIGDLAETPRSLLARRFGLYGEALHALAWGRDDTPVTPSHQAPAAKSLGHEHTLAEDIESPQTGLQLLLALAERVGCDVRREGYAGRCVRLKLRFSDFSSITRQRVMAVPSQETRDIYRVAKELFLGHYCGGGVRLLGLTLAELQPTGGRRQIGLFPEDRRYRELIDTLDGIREHYGDDSIQPAGALPDRRQTTRTATGAHAPGVTNASGSSRAMRAGRPGGAPGEVPSGESTEDSSAEQPRHAGRFV